MSTFVLTRSAHPTPADERAAIRLNVNLDSVGGAQGLTALCSDRPDLAAHVAETCAANGFEVATFVPLMANSDHANFALAGIPAFRLVAGYDDPAAHLRYVLTPGDTRDKVAQSELRQATLLTAALVAAACNADPDEAARWRA